MKDVKFFLEQDQMVLLSQDFNGSTNVLTTYLQDQECKTLFLQVKRIREKKKQG